MPIAERIFLQVPPPVNPNGKRNTALITVDDIDSYTQFTPKQLKNFWRKVNKDGAIPSHVPHLGKCWQWTGASFGRGYGCFSMFGRMRKVHRVSYLIHKGEIKPIEGSGHNGTCVIHKCDNRGCVNPDHLELGTNADNMRDMNAKGRGYYPSGEKSPCAKLTNEKVRQIRARKANGESTRTLAKDFGVSMVLIQAIVRRAMWKHV